MRPAWRIAAVLCLTGGLAAASAGGPAWAYTKSSITIDARSGLVLQAHNADARHPPASLSKLMTLYLTFEAMSRGRFGWNTRVRISRYAARRQPSKLYLRAGQRVRIRDLVYATAIKSANDAAAALAEKIAGSERRFARLMTRRARELGMRRTVFGTASGLPARGQRTTARDMAILARSLIHHFPQYTKVFATRFYRYGRRGFRNTNRLLRSHPHVKGMKTGYTRRARYNLVTSANNGKVHLITVVLGARTSSHRYWKTKRLLAGGWRTAHSSAYLRKRPRGYVRIAMRSSVGGAPAVKTAARTAGKSGTVQRGAARARKSAQVAALPKKRPDKRRIGLSLTSAAVAAPRLAAARRPAVQPRQGSKARRRSVHGVQVGAFYRRHQARSAIRRAMRALPKSYRHRAKSAVVRSRGRKRTIYAARLMGFEPAPGAARLRNRAAARHRLHAGLDQGGRQSAGREERRQPKREGETPVCDTGRRFHSLQMGPARPRTGPQGLARTTGRRHERPHSGETKPVAPADLPGPHNRPFLQRSPRSLQYPETAQPRLHGDQDFRKRLSRQDQTRRYRPSSAGVAPAIAILASPRSAGRQRRRHSSNRHSPASTGRTAAAT